MTTLKVKYKNQTQLVQVLNKWDINGREIVNLHDVTWNDVGKLLELDDGSEWYTPIIAFKGNTVRTDIGCFNRRDLCTISVVRLRGTQYSGLYRSDQHLAVVPPSNYEYQRVEAFFNNQFKGQLSKRELMITQEKLQEQCERYKIDDKWVISRLYDEARNDKNKGFERLEAIKILARIMGVEIGSPMPTNTNSQPLFANINVLSIQDQRRQQVNLQKAYAQAIEYTQDLIEQIPNKPEEIIVEEKKTKYNLLND